MLPIKQLVDQAISMAAGKSNERDDIVNHIAVGLGLRLEQVQNCLPAKLKGRDLGFHASMAGWCYRRVVTEALNKGFSHIEEDAEKNRIFLIGHTFHDLIHEALGKRLWHENGSILHIQPMRLIAFENPANGFRVVGTPDEVLLDLDTMDWHIVDLKTAGERSFAWTLKKEKMYGVEAAYKQEHKLQVGTYIEALLNMLEGSPLGHALSLLRHFLSRAGSDLPMDPDCPEPLQKIVVHGHVYQVEKNVLESYSSYVGEGRSLALEAATYWRTVESYWREARIKETMPPSRPVQAWQCGYCPLFPVDGSAMDTRKKRALTLCEQTSDEELLGHAQEPEVSAEIEIPPQIDTPRIPLAAVQLPGGGWVWMPAFEEVEA